MRDEIQDGYDSRNLIDQYVAVMFISLSLSLFFFF